MPISSGRSTSCATACACRRTSRVADSLVRGADSFAVSAFAEDAAVDAAFAELYEANFSRVYSFVRAQVATSADAHEVVGRVFFKAYSHWRGAPRHEEAVL